MTNFFSDCSIFGRRPHHQVRWDLIYSPTSTSDRCASKPRSSLRRPPPRTGTCGRVGHFPATCFHLKTRQPPTRPSMPMVLPFDNCSCEFYSLLSPVAPAFCSFCTISSHSSRCCDSQHLHTLWSLLVTLFC